MANWALVARSAAQRSRPNQSSALVEKNGWKCHVSANQIWRTAPLVQRGSLCVHCITQKGAIRFLILHLPQSVQR
ncbi:hypothetical protein N7532_012137 [Penicillium argentinense]|uniref:Uncharacterized protein n=1 Tax=Penicillium argentinense TaxID=1131581 RepID=A0A9W9EJX2_9EURO|nr:uncharacterized protein N7532_012137 [Penicillium argentinense]KAJ5083094.1 hypothetical protein N7532_012137 [Penicillium argentinense]